jgi:diaminopimelate epimerase
MPLSFSKMHGIGNDFVVVDARDGGFDPPPAQVAAIADRHTGVGFDQLLSIEPSPDPSCAFYYGIWNADGSPAGQCGNGVRCVAAWLHRAGAIPVDHDTRLLSPSGPVTVRVLPDGRVSVDMGEPQFSPASLPFSAEAAETYDLTAGHETVTLRVVSMGNPHAVVEVDDIEDMRWNELAPLLTSHGAFPEGCNIGFVHQLDAGHVELRVHERGSGWTRACGTGACAAAAVLMRAGRLDTTAWVDLPGGPLQIDWAGPGHSLWMTGPAAFVFEGEIAA